MKIIDTVMLSINIEALTEVLRIIKKLHKNTNFHMEIWVAFNFIKHVMVQNLQNL